MAADAGVDALARWAGRRAPELAVVAQQRDADKSTIDRALEIVRRFIIDRGLVLFGGLAIDRALRLRGGRIYPDGERPDFDVLSPRSVDDAYDLADMLHAAGFDGVGAVRGIHVQTMRVRTDFVWVADVGFAPPDVFARVPTLTTADGMRVVHPDFQRMDMHLAFCFPLGNPPQEDVFHRWRKDLARFCLVDALYPLGDADAAGAAGAASDAASGDASGAAGDASGAAGDKSAAGAAGDKSAAGAAGGAKGSAGRLTAGRLTTARLAVDVAGRAAGLTVALQGFAAYAAIRAALDETAAAFGVAAPAVAAPRLALAFPDARTVAVELPVGDTVDFAAPDVAAALGADPPPVWFDPFMDVGFESARAGAAAAVSTRGRLLAVAAVRVAVAGAPAQALVVTPQFLLLHFLLGAHRADDAGAAAACRAFYGHTLEVLRAAEGLFADAAVGGHADAALGVFAESPFGLPVRTLGTTNESAAYIIRMATNAERLGEVFAPALGLTGGDPLAGLPQNYYPATAKRRPTFDHGQSPLFRRSGLARPAPAARP
jgi:hypothetical protein